MNFPLYLVLLILTIVSIAFNEWVAFINRQSKGDHPLAAAEVALGTLYTIGAAWAVDGQYINIWTLFWCFVASGTPMIIGDVVRWVGRQRT